MVQKFPADRLTTREAIEEATPREHVEHLRVGESGYVAAESIKIELPGNAWVDPAARLISADDSAPKVRVTRIPDDMGYKRLKADLSLAGGYPFVRELHQVNGHWAIVEYETPAAPAA